jgi:lysophospholipase L1-like esterase
MGHVVLLGDSIFDNARYVPDRPPVIKQTERSLPAGWRATLLAVDGHVTGDVERQLQRLPADATHLVVSVGGNDALGETGVLRESVQSVGEAMAVLHQTLVQFANDYQKMLRQVMGLGKPATICTIYDSIPGLEPEARSALGAFNEVILRNAFLAGVPVIDLRLLCTQPSDYSPLSPIEPSVAGGAKIARMIAEVIGQHDFSRSRTVIYY